MKMIAILLNLILLSFVGYLIYDKGIPDDEEFFIFLLFTATPFFNLIAILTSHGETFLSLYLKRKALEEKKKIENLQR